ncbi:hypothetical protein EZV62_004805 [Acer yangbiense]|uniref:Aspartic peptidase DDI1-type domain-containing protein n=1 Tax=Acer yangbiense TaxID=1000413 RepID=A0A5C7IL43_9ROSI|nr:hypothetical protein EZV62_004805 [Acer yangbiense]
MDYYEDDEPPDETPEWSTDLDEETPEISLQAMIGSSNPQTMHIRGVIQTKKVVLLVDSGSTHNFLNENVAAKMGLSPTEATRFEVVVANGEKLASKGLCKGVRLVIQGVPMEVDFYLLPLGGYDAVLGAQWLRLLGPILWDFSKLLMKFRIKGKVLELQGEQIEWLGRSKSSKKLAKDKKGFYYKYMQSNWGLSSRRN